MGVPAFFKWLTLRYPKIVMDAIEEVDSQFDINNFLKTKYNADTSMPYLDNVYLDMNGIIHPCCHPQDGRPQPDTEEEMFDNVFDYTDKLIRILKPQKLIYMAVDGVAPRAKMNQQRSRRFRAAQEAKEKNEKEAELLTDWKTKGLQMPEQKTHGFDSNTITPGTTFMQRLASALRIYISHRLQFDPLWKGLTVIFSDSNVPGEGEHKILEFIRQQRLQIHYDPNTKHCIYGADADLIMLSLITHEPHFFIIRESLNENMWKKCDSCGKNGHLREECPKLLNPNEVSKTNTALINSIEFSLIKVHIIREYLELEFKNVKLSFECESSVKFERLIDDFVFLCFFVGNDFIPHLPSLKIREGAIDALLYLYKKILPTLDGFLTEPNGKINLARSEILMQKLSLVEDEIFKKQLYAKNREIQRNAQRAVQEGRIDKSHYQDEIVREYFKLDKPVQEAKLTNNEEIKLFDDILDDIEGILDKDLEKEEKEKASKDLLNKQAADNFQRVLKEVLKKEQNKKMETYSDPVRLGEEGWKSRYYAEKFKVHVDDLDFKALIRQAYIEGICWVYAYYFNGCASWEWYYPFHYAPFASDLCEIKDLVVDFQLGLPFEPVQQLLSVLPPYSSTALPVCLRTLMHDPMSELADFYPDSIKLDVNGQAYAWMGVNLIPFIDENRIRAAVDKKRHLFTEDENTRNRFGQTLVFYHQNEHFIAKHYVKDNFKIQGYYTFISTPNFRIFAGKVLAASGEGLNLTPGKTFKSNLKGIKIKEVRNCEIVSMAYENPPSQPHTSQLLKGVILPPRVVIEDNLDFYSKRNFRGDEAINTVRRILGFDQDELENQMRAEVFDYSYNNNRAIEYNPHDMDMLRKKRHKQFESHEARDYRNDDRNQNTQRNYNRDQREQRNYNYKDNRSYDNRQQYNDGRQDNRYYDNRNREYATRHPPSQNYNNNFNHYNQNNQYKQNVPFYPNNQQGGQNNIQFNSNSHNALYNQNTQYVQPPGNVNRNNQFNNPNLKTSMSRLASLIPPSTTHESSDSTQKDTINNTLNEIVKNFRTYSGKKDQ